ncbi:FHA domain-containing protein [Massilia sp. CFBP 13721]|uniref:FHA domain-containing protein n=2 Tax=unclassified Massilia TaxID=2609279 RepID=UPI001786059D|nr:FHA domain-containing protein [Massilia sp. CFBP 13721]MBD8672029.1 FHA domain-containing protein [Massilia sp. CFBP 13721]
MTASDAMPAAARAAPAGRLKIVLVPVSHPDLAPIQIHESLFAIGRTEAPFDAYPATLAADLSRRHARIFCEHGAVYFAELGSKNGSTVNGVAVRQTIVTLQDGDLLGLGKTLNYKVQLDAAARAPEPPQARLASMTLTPEDGAASLQPIVVTEFPFMVSKADDTFARYKDVDPAQVNYLSRRHAHIFLRGGQPHIEDLGSTNGSFVNGVRLDEHALALNEGDVLAFGGRHFVYRISLAWDASARDPTLTRIGVFAQPALDADRTTFVAAADSFLDIFCVDAAPAADATPRADAAPADAPDGADRPAQGKAAVMLAGLHAALGGKRPLDLRRLRFYGLGTLAAAALLAWAVLGIGGAEREIEGLLAERAYVQAAARAGEALAADPGDSRLRALDTEALLKATLPGWMAALKAGRFDAAARQVAALRGRARNNPELAPLLDQLDWIVALQAFVAGRGGAQAPSRDARDGARIAQFLAQWEARNESYQRAFETMSAHVPAYRDAYADALSNIRGLALARSQPAQPGYEEPAARSDP